MTHHPEWQSKTCETCRWWTASSYNKPIGPQVGDCALIRTIGPTSSIGAKIVGGTGSWISTNHTFGCAMHELTPPNAGAEHD